MEATTLDFRNPWELYSLTKATVSGADAAGLRRAIDEGAASHGNRDGVVDLEEVERSQASFVAMVRQYQGHEPPRDGGLTVNGRYPAAVDLVQYLIVGAEGNVDDASDVQVFMEYRQVFPGKGTGAHVVALIPPSQEPTHRPSDAPPAPVNEGTTLRLPLGFIIGEASLLPPDARTEEGGRTIFFKGGTRAYEVVMEPDGTVEYPNSTVSAMEPRKAGTGLGPVTALLLLGVGITLRRKREA